MRLSQKYAVVTGGLRGIGRAVADRFAAEGAHVFMLDLDQPDNADLAGLPANTTYLQADVSNEVDWQRAVQSMAKVTDKLHVLVNNAGIDGVSAVEAMSLEQWRRVHSVNTDGAFLATKHCHALLANGGIDNRAGASIVNISSIMGKVGFTDTSAYNTSKGALKLFTKATAIEFATKKTPIRVNSVHPGFVVTPLLEKGLERLVDIGVAETTDDVAGSIAAMTPIGRLADPSEIANAVLFLASEEASYITGSEIYVDGGWTAQ